MLLHLDNIWEEFMSDVDLNLDLGLGVIDMTTEIETTEDTHPTDILLTEDMHLIDDHLDEIDMTVTETESLIMIDILQDDLAMTSVLAMTLIRVVLIIR